MFRVMKRGKKRATLAVFLVMALLLSNIIAPISAFALEDCYLFLCAYPSEGGTVEGDGNYTAGQEVSINAVPNPGYKFDHWEAYCGGELADPLQASTTYTVPEGTAEVMAYFVPVYELTLQTDPVEGGTTAGEGEYMEMEEVQISAAAAEGYKFAGWTDTAGVLGGNVNETSASFYMPANPISLTANFVPVYELTLQTDPVEGGTTAGEGEYMEMEEVQISAVAAEGYKFAGWTDDGGVLADDDLEKAVVTFVMPAEAVSLTANFVPSYDLTLFANPAEGGEALDLTAGGPYEEGTEVEISAIANDGYKFVNWTATNFVHLIENVNAAITKFIMPAAHETLTANFKNYAIADLEVAVPNHTVYVPTDYTFTFESVTELNKNLGDKIFIVTDPYYAGFDYSGINPEEIPITITINGEESSYVTNASWDDEDNPQMLEINLPADIPSGSLLKFTLSGVKNPPTIGEAVPALVHIGGEGGDPLSIALEEAVEFILPSLSITPVAGSEDKPVAEEDDPIEVNQRRKLIVELKDELGVPFVVPQDITGTLYSNSNGDFYNEYADVYTDSSLTFLSGSSGTYKYYRPLAVGNHTVDNFSGSWYPSSTPFAGGYLQATSPTIPVAPAGEVEAWMNYSQFPSIQAGNTGHFAITVENRDQYWNQTEQTRNISIMLEAVAYHITDGSPLEEGEFKGKLLLPEKDAEGNIKYDNDGNMLFVNCGDSTVVEIPEGERTVDFYYYDEKSTIWPNDYAVSIIATAENLNVLDQSVTVYPLSQSEKLVILPMDGVEKVAGAKYELQLQVQDAFGNVTDPQPWALTVSLTSSSETGKFYSDYWLDTQITQVTLSSENVKTFYYVDTAVSDPATITATATDLQSGSLELSVVQPPEFTVTAASSSLEVYLHNEINIALNKSYPYDIIVYLSSTVEEDDLVYFSGTFYPSPADNVASIDSVLIPAGETGTTVYYRSRVVGTHTVWAYTDSFGGLEAAGNPFTVTPAAQVKHQLALESGHFTAGVPGQVNLVILDQYGHPVTQTGPKIVYLAVYALDKGKSVENFSGRLLKADADGSLIGGDNAANWVDVDENGLVIPDGESGCSFYYYDERATGDDYNIFLQTGTEHLNMDNYRQKVTVKPAPAAMVRVSAVEGSSRVIYDTFPLLVELVDKFGNLAAAQDEPVTIELTTDSPTGRFYSDASLTNRISQLTFAYDQMMGDFFPGQLIYYVDSKAAEKVQISGAAQTPTIKAGAVDLTVLPLPCSITLEEGEGDDWLIQQRRKVIVKLWNNGAESEIYDDPYVVPAELEEGLLLQLTGNPGGKFYTHLVGGEELEGNNVAVPPGASQIEVYFKPESPGHVQLAAGFSYRSGGIAAGGAADIVWVVDRSDSMDSAAQSIARNVGAFANLLQEGGIKYNLGILYYEGEASYQADSNVPVTFNNGTRFTRDPDEFQQNMLWISQNTRGGWEETMTAVQQALDYPFTGSSRFIIMVTDEYGDDNHLYAETLAKAQNAGAVVYGIYDYFSISQELCDLVAETGGMEIDIYGNWLTGLSTLATDIISQTPSGATVFGVLNIDVSAAGRVRAILEGDLHFTAGVPGEVCVALVDQYGNRTTEDFDLNVALHTSSANGNFYLSPDVDNDGKPTADSIANILIPQGESKAIVYYYDTKTTGGDYQLFLDVKPAGCDGDVREAFVYPADSKNLMISVWDYEEFSDLQIENQYGYLVLPGHSGEQDKLLSGMLFPVTVSIVDAMGNPVPQSTPLTVNLSAEKDDPDAPGYGKFYLDEEGTLPVTQITIGGDAGSRAALYFVAKGNKELNFTLQAAAPGLAKGEKTVTVLEAEELRIHFPWGDNAANPEQRKPFAIVLTDAQGHPAKAVEEIQVALQGGSFFMGPEDYEEVTGVTIKAGRQGIMLFVEAGRLEGPMAIIAVAENYEKAGAVLDVKHYPYYTRELFRGWNILSIPLELKYNTLTDIVKDAEDVIDLAYYFDSVNKEWKLITTADYGDMPINPTDAVYLKLKGKTLAEFYPLESPSGPYNRTLKQGWNLFGPAFDLSDWNAHQMRASNVLSSLSGQFVHVISPRTEVQNPWAYIPGLSRNPDMRVTEGYWIYMKEEGILPGFSYTPVSGNYYGHIPCPGDDDYWGVMEMPDLTVSPPPLPAAFYGDVVDAEGNTIEEGTIEAVVDGIVRGRITFTGGQFGLSEGARLVVQSMTNLGSKKINFYVNGYRAMESFRWSDTSGYLSGVTLTVDTSAVQEGLVYKGLAVRDPYTVELAFNVNILNNLDNPDDLKGAVQFSSSLGTFLPLSEEDSVFIEKDMLVIKFSQRITGNDNEITLAANALKDEDNNVLNYTIRTAPFNAEDIVIDECFIATAAFGTKFDPAVALLRKFRDKCLLTNTLGQEFVALYYRTSPPIAAFIAGNGFLRGAVRMLLVPFIVLAYLMLNPVAGVLMTAVILAFIVYRRRFRIKALH